MQHGGEGRGPPRQRVVGETEGGVACRVGGLALGGLERGPTLHSAQSSPPARGWDESSPVEMRTAQWHVAGEEKKANSYGFTVNRE